MPKSRELLSAQPQSSAAAVAPSCLWDTLDSEVSPPPPSALPLLPSQAAEKLGWRPEGETGAEPSPSSRPRRDRRAVLRAVQGTGSHYLFLWVFILMPSFFAAGRARWSKSLVSMETPAPSGIP